MMFNQYPYININDLNLDYILSQIKVMMNEVTNFVSINAIKYADPIQWDITRQYEKNTVVIDPVTGTAYISVAPVPAGVALTRPEYWTVVFDLGSFVTKAAQNFTRRYESKTTTSATFSTNTGEWLVWGDVLYKALTNITAGDSYVVGGNIDHFTIEDLYNAYLNTIASILAMVGDLDTLNTSDKSNLVNAINEIYTTVSNIVKYRAFVVPEVFGAVGDGITDDTAAINAAIAAAENTGMVLYFPAGKSYGISSTIHINSADVVMDSPINELGNDNAFDALVVGAPDTRLYYKRLKLWVTCDNRYPMADNYTGIILHNINDSDIEIVRVARFTNGIEMLGTNNAFVSNRIILGAINDCQYGLILKSIGNGFVNDNTFFKGYFGISSQFEAGIDVTNITITSDGVYQNNNSNVFYSPSFEGRTRTTPIHIYYGRNNKFIECRNENTNSTGYFMICENTSRMNRASFIYCTSDASARVLDKSDVGTNIASLYDYQKITSFSAHKDISTNGTTVTTANGAFFISSGTIPSDSVNASYVDISNGTVKGVSDSSPAVLMGCYVDTTDVKQFILNVNSTGTLALGVVCYDANDAIISTYTPSTPEWQYAKPIKFGEEIQTPFLVSNKFYSGSTFNINSYDFRVTIAPEVKRALIGVYLKTSGAIKGFNVSSISNDKRNYTPEVLI